MNKTFAWGAVIFFALLFYIHLLTTQKRQSQFGLPLSDTWITNLKAKDCVPYQASSYEALKTAFEALRLDNIPALSVLMARKAIDPISDKNQGLEVRVLELRKMGLMTFAKLDNKSDVDEIWVDSRCLVKK